MKPFGLALSFLWIGCSSMAPPLSPDSLPSFDSAFVCQRTTGVRAVLPDKIDIERHCIAIDAVAFRELILAGVPGEDFGDFWKEGGVAIGRSRQYGDQYILFRWLSPDFVRPGVPGTYRIPPRLTDRWQRLVYNPLNLRAQVGVPREPTTDARP